MTNVVTMRDLLEAGVHFGHSSRYWNPKMRSYIYGTREKVHIIDLEYTLQALRKTQDFVRDLAKNRNKLLFVSTKRAAREHIEIAARSINQPYVCNRWLGGMLTNYKTIRMSIRRYNDLKIQFEDGTINKLTKKEILMRQRELQKLESSIGGIKDMGGLPDAVFIIDIDREAIAVKEVANLGIPVIALVDTNCNPDDIDYIIPGNDDSSKSIKLFIDAITQAYAEGAQEAEVQSPSEDSGPLITKARKKASLSLRKAKADSESQASVAASSGTETSVDANVEGKSTEDAPAEKETAPVEEVAEEQTEFQLTSQNTDSDNNDTNK